MLRKLWTKAFVGNYSVQRLGFSRASSCRADLQQAAGWLGCEEHGKSWLPREPNGYSCFHLAEDPRHFISRGLLMTITCPSTGAESLPRELERSDLQEGPLPTKNSRIQLAREVSLSSCF